MALRLPEKLDVARRAIVELGEKREIVPLLELVDHALGDTRR